MNVKLRRARGSDARTVFSSLRPEDYREVQAASGLDDPTEMLFAGFEMSEVTYAMRVEGRPIAVLGLVRHPIGNVVWLLATPSVNRHRLDVLRHGRDVADKWFRRYGTLLCIADDRNTLHQRWIKLIGFEEAGKPNSEGAVPFTRYLYRSRR